MKNKSVYLYCASGPTLLSLIVACSWFVIVDLWHILFFWSLFMVIKRRKDVKSVLQQYKNIFYLLMVLSICLICLIGVNVYKNLAPSFFQSTYLVIWLLVFSVFYGKKLFTNLTHKRITAAVIIVFIVSGLLFSFFGYMAEMKRDNAYNARMTEMKNCEKSCPPEDRQCTTTCYGDGISLGCGDGFSIY